MPDPAPTITILVSAYDYLRGRAYVADEWEAEAAKLRAELDALQGRKPRLSYDALKARQQKGWQTRRGKG